MFNKKILCISDTFVSYTVTGKRTSLVVVVYNTKKTIVYDMRTRVCVTMTKEIYELIFK